MHAHIAERFGVGEDAPCADASLLVPLKRSRAFRSVRADLAGAAPHHPIDSWADDGLDFFVFALRAAPGASNGDVPLAVFAMHADHADPVSAVVIPRVDDANAEVRWLLDETVPYTIPYEVGSGSDTAPSNN